MKVQQPFFQERSGFTLLEVVVAITIFGICISLVYVLYNSVTSIVTSVERQAKLDNTAKIILDRFYEDLAAVYVGKQGYVVGGEPGGFSTEDPVLVITTTAHLRLSQKEPPVDVAVVRYYLREQSNAETFSLLRSDTPVVVDIEAGALVEQKRYLLSDEVVKLEIVYMGLDGEEHSEWDSINDFDAEQDNSERFPQGYKMLLSLGSDGDSEAALTTYQVSVTPPTYLIEFEGEQ